MTRFLVQFETEDDQALIKALVFLQENGFNPTLQAVADEPKPVARIPVVARLDRDTAWMKLLSALKPNPKKVLQFIKTGPPNGLSARMIADQFKQKPNWFTGVLNGGIQRNVKSAGFQLEDVVVITQYRGMITYAPGPELKRRELKSPLPPSPAYAPIDGDEVNEALHLGD